MIAITIHEPACRGCAMCVDNCPTDVFTLDPASGWAIVGEVADCIECLTCAYDCPSGAIYQRDYRPVKNFYRDLAVCTTTERIL